MTPQDVQQKQFNRAKRGFDPQQVRTFLDQVAASMAARDRELHEARTEIEALGRAVVDVKQNEEAFRLTMMAATEAKEEMLRQAAERAASLEEEARAAAEMIAERARVDAEDRSASLRHDIASLQDQKARLEAQLAEIRDGVHSASNPHSTAAGQEASGRPPLELVVDQDQALSDIASQLAARVGDLRG